MTLQMKVPTTYTEQLAKLKERGCVIEDEAACCEVLKAVNYYRLSAYFLPFRDANGHYKDGTTFRKATASMSSTASCAVSCFRRSKK